MLTLVYVVGVQCHCQLTAIKHVEVIVALTRSKNFVSLCSLLPHKMLLILLYQREFNCSESRSKSDQKVNFLVSGFKLCLSDDVFVDKERYC
jgi:hypothetical protein